MARSLVDTAALEQLHQSLLVALRSGAAPWFADVLRDYDEVGDLSDRGRRKMPAMMRGADGRHLALTRRQVATIRALARGPVFPDEEERHREHRAAQPHRPAAPPGRRQPAQHPAGLRDLQLLPGLEFDFRNIWRRVFEGIEIHEANGFVVRAEGELSRLRGPLRDRGRRRAQPRSACADRPATEEDAELQGIAWLEWSNFLADVLATRSASWCRCEFFDVAVRRPPRPSSCGSGRSSSAARSPAR